MKEKTFDALFDEKVRYLLSMYQSLRAVESALLEIGANEAFTDKVLVLAHLRNSAPLSFEKLVKRYETYLFSRLQGELETYFRRIYVAIYEPWELEGAVTTPKELARAIAVPFNTDSISFKACIGEYALSFSFEIGQKDTASNFMIMRGEKKILKQGLYEAGIKISPDLTSKKFRQTIKFMSFLRHMLGTKGNTTTGHPLLTRKIEEKYGVTPPSFLSLVLVDATRAANKSLPRLLTKDKEVIKLIKAGKILQLKNYIKRELEYQWKDLLPIGQFVLRAHTNELLKKCKARLNN